MKKKFPRKKRNIKMETRKDIKEKSSRKSLYLREDNSRSEEDDDNDNE
jgi:hypothetical protein